MASYRRGKRYRSNEPHMQDVKVTWRERGRGGGSILTKYLT